MFSYRFFYKQSLTIPVLQKLDFIKPAFPERGFITLVFLWEIISDDFKKKSNCRLIYSDYLLFVQESDSNPLSEYLQLTLGKP